MLFFRMAMVALMSFFLSTSLMAKPDTSFKIGKPADASTVGPLGNVTGECGQDADGFEDTNYSGKTAYCHVQMFIFPDHRKNLQAQVCIVDNAGVMDVKASITSWAFDYSSVYTCVQDGRVWKKYTGQCSSETGGCNGVNGTRRILVPADQDIGVTT